MTRHERAADHVRNTVRKLLPAGERLPDRTRREILALKDAAVGPLLDILGDDELAMSSAPGRGYAPAHAVWLLTELRAESAIESMLDILAETEWDTILHEAIVQALPRFGAAVLEPTLRAHDDERYGECRGSLASILANLRIHDDRILAVLREQLALDPRLCASDLAKYGDPRVLENLVRAYDGYQIIDTGHPFANQALTEIREAIQELGGALTPAQERKYVRAMEPYERWRRQRAAARSTPSRPARRELPGRNDPCWCGSAQKYKKCHLDADQIEAFAEGAQP
jgi:SEC-C motif-containing protein